jgi:hypothetical protein
VRYNRFGNAGLTAGEICELDMLSALVSQYPGWMVQRQGMDAGRTSARRTVR